MPTMELIVPFTFGDTGEPVDAEAFMVLEEKLMDYFGGYTSQDVQGGWSSPSGERFRDQSVKYVATNDELDPETFEVYAQGIAEAVKDYWRQQEVFFRVGKQEEIEKKPQPLSKDLLNPPEATLGRDCDCDAFGVECVGGE